MFGYEITNIRRLKDKTFNITLNTQEMTPEDGATLLSIADFGFCMLKDVHFDEEELKMLDDANVPAFGKSPSEKLRAALFVNWKANSQGYDDFVDFYRREMELLRQKVLSEVKEPE